MAEIIGKEVILKDENGEVIVPYVGYASSGRNVGDIFYTTRLDTELNGAVECNGGTYNTADFSGNQSIGNLLRGGKLPYVSLEEYESIITVNGSCRAFGWDGGDSFRVPLLNDVYIEAGNAESVGEFISESLPNIKGEYNVWWSTVNAPSGAFYGSNSTSNGSGNGGTTGPFFDTMNFDASLSSSTYQDGAKVKPDSVRYRAMVQLAIKTTDDAVITVTSGLQQIANKAENDLSNLSTDGVNYINDTINNIITERDNKYNWNAVVTKSTNTDYTAEFTGLLWCYGQEGNGTRAITINGASFNWCYHYGSGYSSGEVQVPLHKGDKFRVGATDSGSNIYFIPAK